MRALIYMLIILALVLFMALLGVVVFFILIPFCIAPNRKRDVSYFKAKYFAHRGLHDEQVPENSVTAFKKAVAEGYGVELDVQMTLDKRLVVFHDGNVQRMCGIDARIRDLTYEELSKLRLKNTNETIPLFEDVLSALGNSDLICEIKGDNGNKNYELCERAYNMLCTYKGTYCIESFSPYLVGWFKKNHPEIIRGQLSQKFRKADNMSFFKRVAMTNLLVNVISRPDFIAYKHQDIHTFGFWMVRRIFRPLLIAWTAKGASEQDKAWEVFDSVIFEMHGDK